MSHWQGVNLQLALWTVIQIYLDCLLLQNCINWLFTKYTIIIIFDFSVFELYELYVELWD